MCAFYFLGFAVHVFDGGWRVYSHHLFTVLFVIVFMSVYTIQVLLLVKQRGRVTELKKSAELEIEDIKKNSPGELK